MANTVFEMFFNDSLCYTMSNQGGEIDESGRENHQYARANHGET